MKQEKIVPDHTVVHLGDSKIAAYEVSDLMAGSDTLILLHNGQPYTLRVTRHGKLLLTK